jgi:tetratricopeptide (TPR) repeat protein
VPPIAFFAVAMTSGVNIGVRHVLPVYPCAAGAAAAAGCALARAHRVGAWAVAALLAFHAVAAARTAPDYLAFANDLWGGTDRAYLLLHDSNVDWGQNLERIGEYLDREGVATCWLASYGNADVARALLPRCRLLPAPGWANGDEPVDAVPPVIEGTVLVSASVLADPAGAAYAPIAAAEPVAVVGGGILVFRGRFEVPLVAALSHLDRADQLARMGRVDEAAGDARAAIALAPGDAWAHLALAKLLVRAGRGDEARAPAEAAVRLARAEPARFGPAGEEAGRLLTALGPHAAPGAAR